MSSTQNVVFFDENGLRTDGRKPDEIRPMKIKIGVLSRANGSCYLEWGANKVLAAVYGPREAHPRRTQRADQAVIRYRYNMQSFSVEERARPGPSRRSSEISKVSREAFEPVIFTESFPKAAIDIYVEVLQADAGTRTAAINAASLALVDAGIPMKGLVSACAVGKVDGKLVLDLNKPEDNYGEADLPVAMTEDGEITLIQMDGDLSPEEFTTALDMVTEGCRQVLAIQKEALKEKFGAFGSFETRTLPVNEDADDIAGDDAADDDIIGDDVADDDIIGDDIADDDIIGDDIADDANSADLDPDADDIDADDIGGDINEEDVSVSIIDEDDLPDEPEDDFREDDDDMDDEVAA